MGTSTEFKNYKTSWVRAILTFLSPILLIMGFRWTLFEPYVIPSGSMIPTLLIHDHIVVSKWPYGLRLPFTEKWVVFWNKPQVGEIVVFRYPKGRDTFFVKRIVATEGDTIEVHEGQLIRNGVPIERQKVENKVVKDSEDEGEIFDYYQEQLGTHRFISRSFRADRRVDDQKIVVPEGHFFVVGDNRDESHDSRAWGFVPLKNLIGRASGIWLSCDETLASAPFVCDPKTIRWKRLFSAID